MVDTPSSKPQSGAAPGASPEPFKRGQITWSRPPQQVFRVGPSLSGSTPAPAPAKRQVAQAPQRATGAGILSGSMIPRVAPAATPTQTPIRTAPLPTPRADAASATVSSPVDPATPAPSRPQPVAAAAEVARLPEPATAPPRTVAPAPVLEPVVPSYATAARRRSGVPKAVWIGAAAIALVLAAGAGWWVLKPDASVPGPTDVSSVPTAAAPALTTPAPVEAVPLAEGAVDAAEVETVPSTARPSTTPAPTTAAPVRAAPTAAAPAQTSRPSETSRLNVEATAPRIETAPLIVAPVAPPPTAAEAAQTDPDAPVQTRPQPLN